jgi:Na+/proline symporter
MSNVNSILLVASSGLSYDIYGKYLRPMATDKAKLFVSRLSIVLLSIVPIVFALQRYSDVQSLVVIQTRFIASFFFVPVILGLNTKTGRSASVVGAMLGGAAGCLIWSIWASHHKSAIDASEIGILSSALVYFVADKWMPGDAAMALEGGQS